jgi:6-phosphofructokinase 1
MSDKIVVVTAGGPISCFHAGMKRMHEVLETEAPGKFELYGARGGLEGLIKGVFEPVCYEDLEEDRAGSLIGADRDIANAEKIVDVVKANDIYAVVMMGGDNHLGEAKKVYEETGVNIIGYPKTMDNDLSHTDVALGYETAVTVGVRWTRLHHNTAMSVRTNITIGRVFYVGLFGRDSDWVLSGVTMWGCGDRGIVGEQKYDWDYVWRKINASLDENEDNYGIRFAVVPYSEGAQIKGIEIPPEHRYSDMHEIKLQPEWVGMELVRLTKDSGMPASFESHTYSMRDAPPTETDKRLSRMAGEECIRMILDRDFGKSVVFKAKGDFYTVSREGLARVAVKRRLKPTGYFDYDELRPNPSFAEAYCNLFRASLGEPVAKEELIYKNML